MTTLLSKLLKEKIIDILAFKYHTAGNRPEAWEKLYLHYTTTIPYPEQMKNPGIRTIVHQSLWPIPTPPCPGL